MTNNFSPLERASLREACDFHGGIKVVANKAQCQAQNLSNWLRGGGTLSDVAVRRFLDVMGLSEWRVDENRVHEWSINWMRDGFSKGIEVYFPNGGQVTRAPWSRWGAKAIMKQLALSRFGKGANPPEIYAISDGKVKAILRRTPGLPISLRDFGKKFKWRGGEIDTAVLNISIRDTTWIDGGVSIENFDNAWGVNRATVEDITEYLYEINADEYEVLQLIKKNFPRKLDTI
ncbi:MAG: hypothetical protein NUV50_03885 [Rhodospirillales bacterium]|nr:hypothetical protein [Rhodospirillales bacterium]